MKPSELQQVLDGRRRAIDRFVRDYAETVEKAVAMALRGRVGALPASSVQTLRRDIVNDVWCWLLDRERTVLRSYDASRGTMDGFLFMKVCSEARRLHDRRYRARTEPIEASEEALPGLPPPNGLAVRYELYDHARKLWAEIEARLSPAEREAFVGRILQGKTAREVADELGRSEDAVHQGVSRAIKRARQVLARRGSELEKVLPLLALLLGSDVPAPVKTMSGEGSPMPSIHGGDRP
jgi:RNA polymerase sigma factor (sigma-70 family)